MYKMNSLHKDLLSIYYVPGNSRCSSDFYADFALYSSSHLSNRYFTHNIQFRLFADIKNLTSLYFPTNSSFFEYLDSVLLIFIE